MQKFLYQDIVQQSPTIDYLEVQSFEMNVYLVKVTVGEKTAMVYDSQDKPMRFFNAGHIREAFAQCTVSESVMTHDTPYEEMIGNPPKAQGSITLPFSMALPY